MNLQSGYEQQHYEWGAQSWPNYMVRDFYQESLFRKGIDMEANIQIAGRILFGDSDLEVPQIKDLSNEVFDIQPQRQVLYFGLNTNCNYQTA